MSKIRRTPSRQILLTDGSRPDGRGYLAGLSYHDANQPMPDPRHGGGACNVLNLAGNVDTVKGTNKGDLYNSAKLGNFFRNDAGATTNTSNRGDFRNNN